MSVVIWFLYLLVFVPEYTMSARILCVYPIPFESHQAVFKRLTEELAKAGHHLIVLTPLPHESSIPNVTEIDVHDLSYKMWDKIAGDKMKNRSTIKIDPETFVLELAYNTVNSILDAQLTVPEMREIIQDENQQFDLILTEACIRAAIIVSARFKAPIITVSTFFGFGHNYRTMGATLDPLIFPEVFVKKSINLSLRNKLSALYLSLKLRYIDWQIEKVENAMIRKHFGEGAPTMTELKKNVQMLFLNVHHVWDYNRPVPPNVLYLGALHLKEPGSLHQDLKEYLDSSSNGVVYMSLGSKLKSSDLPVPTIRLILKVFASLPYNIIWKWNGAEIPNKPKNLRLETWLPQNDMLHHPNMKVFITHAGLQSTDEAIAARVPVVGLPVFCDQFANADKYEEHGIGIALDIDNLDEDNFREAILEVAENKKYRKNIDNLARLMELERSGALENALRWINHTATHGVHHLRSPLPDLSFVEYYLLDVIAAVIVILSITVAGVVISLKCFLTKFCCSLRYNNRKKTQ